MSLNERGNVLIREFLYVDVEKVRSILAQVEGSVPETSTAAERSVRHGRADNKMPHNYESSDESRINKSLADSLFPSLEESLNAEDLVRDITDEVKDPEYWTSGSLRSDNPPGSLIRLTAPGALFDARYVAASFAGLSASVTGFQGLDSETPTPTTLPPAVRRRVNKNQNKSKNQTSTSELEDRIPEFTFSGDGDFNSENLRSMIKVARGLFTPGLHLNFFPVVNFDYSVSVRLNEGRQYLDSDSEILFARYGTQEQEWTLVGSIGHHADEGSSIFDGAGSFTDESGRVVRGRAAKFINRFLGFMGASGFSDLPQYPGFSVVPLAVYRQIPIGRHS
ncbi:DUF6414 family protein [Streptomyces bobili]|uniref:Uncharacterized protein n=1 Tax=Streptomyces bobili TaxID=67280 RepID=A0ABZ1R0D4_9ACTN|nr:hypothetical protein [Streptomyces bobili]